MKTRQIIAVLFLAAMAATASAQDYKTGFGLRGGFANGATVKHFIRQDRALEGILETEFRGFNLVGLYEVHNSMNVKGLRWFYGGGGHAGVWRGYEDHPWFKDERDYTVLGIDGIIGIEYTFEKIPLNLCTDWKPAFNLAGCSGFWGDGVGLTARFVLK